MKLFSLLLLTVGVLTAEYGKAEDTTFDFASARGMNLIELSGPGWYPPEKFHEADFKILHDAGFNHVRIMLDYRHFTEAGELRKLSPVKMEKIDRAIQLARQNDLHTTICFFSVPGYSVHRQVQEPSLWEDRDTQEVFIGFWKLFAAHCADIPPSALSFNLINEPPWGLGEKEYADLMRKAIHAIRESDPSRQIVIDGLNSGRLPVMSLAEEPDTVQSAHFYEPFTLTHYHANWIEGSGKFPAADVWPLPHVPAILFGPGHEQASPLVIRGDFSKSAKLTIKLSEIVLSTASPIVISVKGEDGSISRKTLIPHKGWKVLEKFGGSEIARYQTDFTLEIPLPKDPGRKISISVESGDRLSFQEIGLSGSQQKLKPTSGEYVSQPGPVNFSHELGFSPTVVQDKSWIVRNLQQTWTPLIEKGVPVVIQEFGVNHALPHGSAVAYVRDCTEAFQELGMGWCYFSNIGTLGVIGSHRKDAELIPLPDGRSMDLGLFRALSPTQ